MDITSDALHQASVAACRAVWRSMYSGGDWDTECPSKERWIKEEREALLPALEALGIAVIDSNKANSEV